MKYTSIALLVVSGGLLATGAYVMTQQPDQPVDSAKNDAVAPFETHVDPKGRMVLYEVVDAKERGAICNDGSPATYYFDPGEGENANHWIIHLKGGGACSSPEECKQRWQTQRGLMTSKGENTFLTGSGILSADSKKNPDFHDFNRVRVNYCSSDFWAGDNRWEQGDYSIEFRGYKIVGAVLEDLQNEALFPEQNLAGAQRVMFAGGSAGAAGAMNNLDRVAELLSFAEVRGVDDSSWSMKGAVPPYGGEQEVSEEGQKFYMNFINPQMDESCLAEYPGSKLDCLNSRVVSDYLDTPFFLYIDQFDHFVLDALNVTDKKDPDQAKYAEEVATAMRESIQGLDGVLSTRTGRHTGLNSEGFFNASVNGHTYQELLTNWYFDLDGPTQAIAEPR